MAELYKNAPVVEALCEFRFNKDQEWDWTIPGLIYEKIRDDFPVKKQEKLVAAFEIKGDSGINPIPPEVAGIDKMRFIRQDKSALLQVGPHLLTVNQLKPYPGWESFKSLISHILQVYNQEAAPTGIDRIGLRYINKFDAQLFPEDIDIFSYFNIKPTIPIERSLTGFFMRSQLDYSEVDSTLNLVLGNGVEKLRNQDFIMLDLDFHTHNKLQINTCMNWIETAHGFVEEAFKACLSDELVTLLKREG